MAIEGPSTKFEHSRSTMRRRLACEPQLRVPSRASVLRGGEVDRMRSCLPGLILVALPLAGGLAHAACLPTLGTDDCFRQRDRSVQAIEHRYLDAPLRYPMPSRHRRSHGNRLEPS